DPPTLQLNRYIRGKRSLTKTWQTLKHRRAKLFSIESLMN
ncbi:uncharacterized protein METZ01_LOCUS247784, partial [marine metagenome]